MADVEEMDDVAADAGRPHGEVSVIAVPLAGKKLTKKLFKVSKKAAASKILKRGVKEVVKALRKSDGFKGCVSGGVFAVATRRGALLRRARSA